MFYLFILFCNLVILVFAWHEDTSSGGYLQGFTAELALLGSVIFWVAVGIAKIF